jgi:hypothetical protein
MFRGAWLENLRRWRNRPQHDLSIGPHVEALVSGVRRSANALDGLTVDWSAVVPPELSAATRPVAFRRGVLTVQAADSSALFAMDRWLRAGGEPALRAACPALRRVRLVKPGRPR